MAVCCSSWVGREQEGAACRVCPMQPMPHFAGRGEIFLKTDLVSEGTLSIGSGWDLFPCAGQSGPGASSVPPTPKSCFRLHGSRGPISWVDAPRQPPLGPSLSVLRLQSGDQEWKAGPPERSHHRPAGEGAPCQVTQQKEALGRRGGKRTGHSVGQLSLCHQVGASQHSVHFKEQAPPPTPFPEGEKWGSLTSGKQVSP